MIVRRSMLAAGVVVVSLTPGLAQSSKDSPPPLPPVQGRQPAGNPALSRDPALPPYEPLLARLSELMGTLAYLRDLCGKGDGAEWRAQMSALLDAETTTTLRRDRLVGAYNRGFVGYETTYKTCTPSAELVIARSLAEGDRLTHELAARFSGG